MVRWDHQTSQDVAMRDVRSGVAHDACAVYAEIGSENVGEGRDGNVVD